MTRKQIAKLQEKSNRLKRSGKKLSPVGHKVRLLTTNLILLGDCIYDCVEAFGKDWYKLSAASGSWEIISRRDFVIVCRDTDSGLISRQKDAWIEIK